MAYTKLWPIRGSMTSSGMVVSKVIKYDKNEEKTVKKDEFQNSGNVPDGNISINKTFSGGEISNVINYTSNSVKTGEKKYITTINCTEENCIDEMLLTKRRFGETGNRIMYHGVQSFKPGEIDKNNPELAHQLGVKLAKELWGGRFEVVITTHLDREHIHNHFAINSVSFIDGKKFIWDDEYIRMRETSDRLCKEHKLSIIEGSELGGHIHRGAMRAESEGRYTIESIVKEDIDLCIRCSKTLDDWYELMRQKGYRIDCSGKYLKVYPYGHSKCIRVDRRFLAKYGLDYSLSGIAEMIADNIASGGYIKPADDMFSISEEILETGYIVDSESLYTADEHVMDKWDENGYSEDAFYFKPFNEYGFKMPRKVKGIQRVYNRYLILLGVHPARSIRRNARTHYLLREDLLKLDKYLAENNLLISKDITDMDTLSNVRNDEIKKLDELNYERNKLRNKIRRAKEEDRPELYEKLAELNGEIKKQRKIVFYLKDIEKSIPIIDKKIIQAEQLSKANDRDKGEFKSERGR